MISLVLVNRGKQPIAANHPVNLALSGHSLSVEISSSKTFHILTNISCLGITLSTIHSAGDRASRAPEASIVQLPTSPLHQLLLLLLQQHQLARSGGKAISPKVALGHTRWSLPSWQLCLPLAHRQLQLARSTTWHPAAATPGRNKQNLNSDSMSENIFLGSR